MNFRLIMKLIENILRNKLNKPKKDEIINQDENGHLFNKSN